MPISNTGVILNPSQTAIDEEQQIFISTFGADVNLDPQSSNGLLVQNDAIAITLRETEQAATVNAMNPDIAEGLQLDAINSNLNIERVSATFSSAPVVINGLPGTPILANSRVSSTTGDTFRIESTVVIGAGGLVNASAIALVSGPVQVGTNTIKNIIDGVPGWDTINNLDPGVVGKLKQNDVQYRKTRVDRLAIASSGSTQSMLAAMAGLNPVSYYVATNRTTDDFTQDGILFLAKSILIVLDGGASDEDVTRTIFSKIGGEAMSGSHAYTIPIPNSLTQTFTANWQIATRRALKLNIKLRLGAIYPPNLPTFIANLINDKFDFNVIGETIEATEFIYILINAGINPIRTFTFDVGSETELSEYTMPISDSLGDSILVSDVVIDYA